MDKRGSVACTSGMSSNGDMGIFMIKTILLEARVVTSSRCALLRAKVVGNQTSIP